MTNKVWFRTGVALLILFLLIKLFLEINNIFMPLVIIVQSVLLPLLLAGFLFYICLPFQKMLEKRHVPRWASITTVSYTHLTLPTKIKWCRSRWSPYH